MTSGHGGFMAKIKRLQAAQRSGGAKISEALRQPAAGLSEPALQKRQRAARRAMEEALGENHAPGAAREIASHLTEWFEEAAFIVALHLDPKRFSKAEVEARVPDVLARVLHHTWEAALAAGYPLPCLDEEAPARGRERRNGPPSSGRRTWP